MGPCTLFRGDLNSPRIARLTLQTRIVLARGCNRRNATAPPSCRETADGDDRLRADDIIHGFQSFNYSIRESRVSVLTGSDMNSSELL